MLGVPGEKPLHDDPDLVAADAQHQMKSGWT